ncbi:hypothetical protein D3C81_1412450 [compost metagenome]
MHAAARFVVTNSKHLYHHVAEHLPRGHAGDRVLLGFKGVIVAIAQGKALAITLSVAAQLLQAVDPVHAQSRFVGPDDGLVDLQQDHTIGQPGDDLLKLAAVGLAGKHGVAHRVSPSGSSALPGA